MSATVWLAGRCAGAGGGQLGGGQAGGGQLGAVQRSSQAREGPVVTARMGGPGQPGQPGQPVRLMIADDIRWSGTG